MSVKKLMPRIIEDIDPPFCPVAVMKYDNDGLYVPASDYAALQARVAGLEEIVSSKDKRICTAIKMIEQGNFDSDDICEVLRRALEEK